MLEKEKYESLSDEMKEHYIERDGKFVLDVTKTDGLCLENVDGLKSTVEKLRASEKTLQTEVKTVENVLKTAQTDHKEFVTKYTGIDPVAAKSALDKIDEIKNWDGETKVREAVQIAEQRTEQKMQSKLDEVVSQNTTKVEELEGNLADSQSQLQEAIVTSKIIEAISKEGGNVDVLMPHVRNQVVMAKDSHGKWRPEVVKSDGTPRIGDSAGNDMTITQLVAEMKTQDTFAACFPGTNSSGSGKTGSSEGGKQKKTNEGKTIASSDDKEMSKNLESIASGKTKVDMSK